MLPHEVSRLLKGILDPYLVERRRRLEHDIAEIQEQCSARGVGTGSPVVALTFNRCGDELDARVGYPWGALRRVLQSGQIELYEGIELDIEAELRSLREPIIADLVQALQKKAAPLKINLEGRLDIVARWDQAVQRAVGEVHLEVFALRSDAKVTGQSTSVHFHGPVGAYQTGAHATSHVVQNVSVQAVGELQSILHEASIQLAGAEHPADLVHEATHVIEQGGEEAAKSKPDWPKLISALNAAVGLLERIPALRSVFYALRGWLSAHLPAP